MRLVITTALVALTAFGALLPAAHAQWAVSYLHPAGATESFGNGVSGVDQVGYARVGGTNHASLWTGSAASFVDINPAVAGSSIAYGTDGVQQSGSYLRPLTTPPDFIITRAGVWNGTAASFVNIHPLGFTPADWQISTDFATAGNLQTGIFTRFESAPPHAAKWNGTAASYVDIHPIGYVPTFDFSDFSQGRGTDGISIVGNVQDGIFPGLQPQLAPSHAGLWKFAPDAFIDLQPASVTKSTAYDVDGNVQVGEVGFSTVSGSPTHAALWSGTAASFVDLNPTGATSSTLRGVDGGFQVGSATLGGVSVAGIWSSTADSFLNLHSLLTPGAYTSSQANGIWTDGITIKVIGTAFNTNLARSEAVLWTVTVPEPATFFLFSTIGFVATYVRYRRTELAGSLSR